MGPHTVDFLVRLFGSTHAVAVAAQVADVTVRQWRSRGSIPARYVSPLIVAAEASGLKLEAADFFRPLNNATEGNAVPSEPVNGQAA